MGAMATTVTEQRADPATERLFHEIRQTLRVTGISLDFRAYAAHGSFFPAMWEAMRPNAETRAFEEAGDRLREEAVHAAAGMDRLSVLGLARLGESQAFQAEAALLLYHYINPKLLVFTSALAGALEGAPPRGPRGSAELLEKGEPARMPPMEMVEEAGAEDPAVRRTLRDIKRTLALEEIHSDYRTLALWPRYLSSAWLRLKPVVGTQGYRMTCQRLTELARELAARLPHSVGLSAQALARQGADPDAVLRQTREFERTLPPLILNVALLALDWQAPELARRSPYPARARHGEAC